MPIPRLMASPGERRSTRWPSTKISPASGRYSPARMLICVDLPAPFSPRRAWTSPHRAEKSTSWLAATPGKCLLMPRISTASAMAGSGLGDVAEDVLVGPVHLLGLQVAVGGRLTGQRRPLEGVAQHLALRHDDVALVVLDRAAPDDLDVLAGFELIDRVRSDFGGIGRNDLAVRSGHQRDSVLHVIEEIGRASCRE